MSITPFVRKSVSSNFESSAGIRRDSSGRSWQLQAIDRTFRVSLKPPQDRQNPRSTRNPLTQNAATSV